MRIGLYIGGSPSVDQVLERTRAAAEAGLDSVFLNQVLGWDALTVAALAVREVANIELGTAVVHTFARHPIALASQALTITSLGAHRFTLGVGPSHPHVIEGNYGLSYERPARHVREYLSALIPLLRGEQVDYRGETVRASGSIDVPGATAPPVLLAALGPVLLRVAGELADGTVTAWAAPRVIADHVAPRITAAAEAAGRPAPRIAAVVSAGVTDDPAHLREQLARQLAAVSQLPSYRDLLDRQQLTGVHETALLGPEEVVAEGVRAYANFGTTDLLVSLRGDIDEQGRTLDLLARLRTGQV